MAIIKNGRISGTVGNITYYTSGGTDMMRSRPG
jgi:hypothetical protein